jgi:hypothetical protein
VVCVQRTENIIALLIRRPYIPIIDNGTMTREEKEMNVLNLTQHPATASQVAVGVIDLPPEERQVLNELLTFEELPTPDELDERAQQVAVLARRAFARDRRLDAVMIGGAPYFMSYLELALRVEGDFAEDLEAEAFRPQILYAFSRRESVEETAPDGSVRKTNFFRHAGFVEAAR